jgi:hypothetical protein
MSVVSHLAQTETSSLADRWDGSSSRFIAGRINSGSANLQVFVAVIGIIA